MSLTNKTEFLSLIEDIQAIAEQKLSAQDAASLGAFVPLYFEESEHEDLKSFSPQDLFGAAMAHFEFAKKRTSGQVKARIYNPDFERDGWQSTHTVIEIVNDDMPFLIDSLAMLLARHNLNLHLLVHPVLSVGRDAAGQSCICRRFSDP